MNVTRFAKRVLYTQISELLGQKFQSYKCNDGKLLLPKFKAVSQTQGELHILKVKKLDKCIRPLFTNPVTYNIIITYKIPNLEVRTIAI